MKVDARADSISGKWDRSRLLSDQFDHATPAPRELAEFFSLENAVLRGAIRSNSDLIAKLSAVALVFEDGPRNDGADQRALAQAIKWLETHPPSSGRRPARQRFTASDRLADANLG